MVNRLSKQSWEEIQAAYSAGRSASALATSYGTTCRAIHTRASRERWRKPSVTDAMLPVLESLNSLNRTVAQLLDLLKCSSSVSRDVRHE